MNVRLVAQSVGRFLAENQKKRLNLVLIDPPRSGTEKQTIPAIARLKPAQISYVSCEPSILARDLREPVRDLLMELGACSLGEARVSDVPDEHVLKPVGALA